MNNDADKTSQNDGEEMQSSAGRKSHAIARGTAPSRWFGVGVGFLIASLFALYALQDPYPYIVFPLAGLGLLIAGSRARGAAALPDAPTLKANLWVLLPVASAMIFVFFGSVAVRRAYDLSWLPIVAGLLVGLVVFLLNESVRRQHFAQSGTRNP